MKKHFSLIVANKKPERQLDSIRHEIKKYFARERRKPVPENYDFWEFDCKFGMSAESSESITEVEIKEKLNGLDVNVDKTFYLEILARPGLKPSKQRS